MDIVEAITGIIIVLVMIVGMPVGLALAVKILTDL